MLLKFDYDTDEMFAFQNNDNKRDEINLSCSACLHESNTITMHEHFQENEMQ